MNLSLSKSLLGVATASFLCAGASAQNIYCLSVHGGPAAGSDNLGSPSKVAAKIGGAPVIDTAPAAGDTPAQVSAAHEARFVAAGYTTMRTGPNEFCVTAGPGAAPLTGGLAYGNDDTNLDLDTKVKRPPARIGPPLPDEKDNGVPVPVPPDNQPPVPLPLPAQITIFVTIEHNGVQVVVQIQIQLPPGLSGLQLRQLIEQILRANGLLPHRVRYPSLFTPGQMVDGLYLERTMSGDRVVGVEYQYDAMARRLIHQQGGAGFLPEFGAGEYGRATQGAAPFEPWTRVNGYPAVGGAFDIDHETGLSFQPGGIAVGLAAGVAPLANGWLMVDPLTSVFEFAMTDAFGVMQKHFAIPNMAVFSGLPLFEQAGVIAPGGQLSLSTAVRCVVD